MRIVGSIDFVSSEKVVGWVADLDAIEKSLELELTINGEKYKTVIANEYRQDVEKAGIGTGRYGFSLMLDDIQKLPGEYEINLLIKDYEVPFNKKPIKLKIEDEKYFSSSVIRSKISEQVKPSGRFLGISSPTKITMLDFKSLVKNAKEKEIPIILFPPFIDWNIPLFQRPHHMARALAKSGALVIFCSLSYLDKSDGFYILEENLIWTNRFNEIFEFLTGSWITIYSTNPNYDINTIKKWKEMGFKLIYEYVDHIDESISSGWTEILKEIYYRLDQDIFDLFIATAKELYRELGKRFEDNIILLPNGVDVAHFQREEIVPEKMKQIKNNGKPVVGYFGALAKWLDWELVYSLANSRPDLNFVFIGPKYELDISLPMAENIYYLGVVPYDELPYYGKQFDVGFIPFRAGKIAETTSPLKLFEYFALKKPVVVTSYMKECTSFPEVFHGSDVKSLSNSIDRALKERKSIEDKLFFYAKENDWKNRAIKLIDTINFIKNQTKTQKDTLLLDLCQSWTIFASNFLKYQSRLVSIYLLPNFFENTLSFGFGQNDLLKGDFVSVKFPVNFQNKYNSCKITIEAPINHELRDYCSYQIFINEKLVAEHKFLSDYTNTNTITYKSKQLINSIEIKLLILQDVLADWKAGEIWRLRVKKIELYHKENISSDLICATSAITKT